MFHKSRTVDDPPAQHSARLATAGDGRPATIVDALHIEKNRALDARATELHALVQVANGIAHSLHAAGHVLGAASDLSAQSQGLSEQLVRLVGEVRAA